MITLRNIAKRFGTHTVLRDISAEFAPKSLTLLSGPNGSGKTTLLKIMAGLLAPSAGEITWQPSERISYVAHATFLYPNLTALENLSFWCRCHGCAKTEDALMRALADVGLGDVFDAYPKTFSRGMCQRLTLARALALEPTLLLLDEPMTGLDTRSQESLRAELLRRTEAGLCTVCISHDVRSDASMATAVLGLSNGTLSAVA